MNNIIIETAMNKELKKAIEEADRLCDYHSSMVADDEFYLLEPDVENLFSTKKKHHIRKPSIYGTFCYCGINTQNYNVSPDFYTAEALNDPSICKNCVKAYWKLMLSDK